MRVRVSFLTRLHINSPITEFIAIWLTYEEPSIFGEGIEVINQNKIKTFYLMKF